MDQYEVKLGHPQRAVIVNADSVSLGVDDWVKFYVQEPQGPGVDTKNKLVHAERAGSVSTIHKLGATPPEGQSPPNADALISDADAATAYLQSWLVRARSAIAALPSINDAEPKEFDLEHEPPVGTVLRLSYETGTPGMVDDRVVVHREKDWILSIDGYICTWNSHILRMMETAAKVEVAEFRTVQLVSATDPSFTDELSTDLKSPLTISWNESLKFERFTDRARRVMVLATEEARILNHNYMGTEHLLLGLVHEGEGVAAKVLTSLGISLEDVRKQVEGIIGRGQHAPPGHIPFTPRAKKVLELSLREALQLGHNYVGTEHILLGLIREGEGVAAQVLAKLGVVNLSQVRQQVMDHLLTLEQSRPTNEEFGTSTLPSSLENKIVTAEEMALAAQERSDAALKQKVRITSLETRIREIQEKAAELKTNPQLRTKDKAVIAEILAVVNGD